MQINWFTLIAQLINFLILVLLLKRFLYGPIIKAMDAREQSIASLLAEAEEKQQQAQEEARAYRERRSELESQRQQTLERAAEEAEARRKELTQKAREEVGEVQTRWREAIEREKSVFLSDLRRRAGRQVCEIASRALEDLADRRLQQHVVEVFLTRLERLDDDDRRALADSLRESGNRIVVATAFEMPPDARERITQAIRRRLADNSDVWFQVSEDLICGIELRPDGRKISWHVAGYLDVLQESVSQALDEEAEAKGGS